MSVRDLFENGKRPNLLFIITDQERQLQHWPSDFCDKHLPSLRQLQQTGLTFQQAFTNACMCSPSRATFLTSQYPSLTGVTTTGSPQPPRSLPTTCAHLAHVVKQAGGYDKIEWQGKWHLGNTPQHYGFTAWDPPDAGNYLTLNETLGGGIPANDVRFLNNILNFIQQQKQEKPPWCLVASFVNPHDVYVAQHYDVEDAGYTKDDLNRIPMPLAPNCREDLAKHAKPRAHAGMSWRRHSEVDDDDDDDGNGDEHNYNSMQEYVNFYAHLHTVVDAQIMQVLDALNSTGQRDSTLIFRLADHGEQALSHGLVEKFYNAYEESIHIPLIVSNPKLKVCGQETHSLVSLLDIMPTVADLLGVSGAFDFYGTSLVGLLDDPATSPNEMVHFTYNDIPNRNHNAPSIIRCVRTERYKYAVYFTPDGMDADWELYDLQVDPEENHNVAGQAGYYGDIQLELEAQLRGVMKKMKTLPGEFEWPPKATPKSRGGPPVIVRNGIQL